VVQKFSGAVSASSANGWSLEVRPRMVNHALPFKGFHGISRANKGECIRSHSCRIISLMQRHGQARCEKTASHRINPQVRNSHTAKKAKIRLPEQNLCFEHVITSIASAGTSGYPLGKITRRVGVGVRVKYEIRPRCAFLHITQGCQPPPWNPANPFTFALARNRKMHALYRASQSMCSEWIIYLPSGRDVLQSLLLSPSGGGAQVCIEEAIETN
jgi:hypothetical protein